MEKYDTGTTDTYPYMFKIIDKLIYIEAAHNSTSGPLPEVDQTGIKRGR